MIFGLAIDNLREWLYNIEYKLNLIIIAGKWKKFFSWGLRQGKVLLGFFRSNI